MSLQRLCLKKGVVFDFEIHGRLFGKKINLTEVNGCFYYEQTHPFATIEFHKDWFVIHKKDNLTENEKIERQKFIDMCAAEALKGILSTQNGVFYVQYSQDQMVKMSFEIAEKMADERDKRNEL